MMTNKINVQINTKMTHNNMNKIATKKNKTIKINNNKMKDNK